MRVKQIFCPSCKHPIYVRLDGTVIAHNNATGQPCLTSNTLVDTSGVPEYQHDLPPH